MEIDGSAERSFEERDERRRVRGVRNNFVSRRESGVTSQSTVGLGPPNVLSLRRTRPPRADQTAT